MPKYRKKPVIIDAIQLTKQSFEDCYNFIGNKNIATWEIDSEENECFIDIQTLEGIMTAKEQDYIIKGVQGEFYPCKPDIFEVTYEKV